MNMVINVNVEFFQFTQACKANQNNNFTTSNGTFCSVASSMCRPGVMNNYIRVSCDNGSVFQKDLDCYNYEDYDHNFDFDDDDYDFDNNFSYHFDYSNPGPRIKKRHLYNYYNDIDIDSDRGDCKDGFGSMDIDVEIEDEEFEFNPSCNFSFNKKFKTHRGLECQIRSGMCSPWSPKRRVVVKCENGLARSIPIACPKR
ncbi:MAG: hypothetical protein ABIA04_08995 [Pseudomonadota bacterium]